MIYINSLISTFFVILAIPSAALVKALSPLTKGIGIAFVNTYDVLSLQLGKRPLKARDPAAWGEILCAYGLMTILMARLLQDIVSLLGVYFG